MKLCIPTLCNYDGVDELIRSAETGTVKPSGYVIIDNGGKYDPTRLARLVTGEGRESSVIAPGKNLGVAASWNYFLERNLDQAIVISNDDIVLGPGAFGELAELSRKHPIAGYGWALFMQRPDCTARVGFYDENFWPAYYEDIDYIIRLEKEGIPQCRLEGKIDVTHKGWATTTQLGSPTWLADAREQNRSYLIAKWGSESAAEAYAAPFGGHGHPPAGWSERTRVPPPPLRWDLINKLAEHIGATRYLELGLADGTCIRRINVKEKWGVDPVRPADAGVATVIENTTDEFFALGMGGQFDLIFIDADHRAEQVYRDVENSVKRLRPGGVIVLHDCSPCSEEMQLVPHTGSYAWTGDVWKTIVRLRVEGKYWTRVVDSNYGLGIVVPGRAPSGGEAPGESALTATYEDLTRNRRGLLGLMSPWEWEEWGLPALRQKAVIPKAELERLREIVKVYGWKAAAVSAGVAEEELRAAYRLQDAADRERLKVFHEAVNAEASGGLSMVTPDEEPEGLRLNLGSGPRPLPGYVNVDLAPSADLVVDLSLPWPWPDAMVSEIRAFDVIEHLPDKIHTMNEAYRVLEPGGLFHIFVPTTDGRGAFQDPTHVSYWNANSFWYYESGNAHRETFGESYGIRARFKIESQKGIVDPSGLITHLEICLRADKSRASKQKENLHDQQLPYFVKVAKSPPPGSFLAEELKRDTLFVVFDQSLRADTTGTHLLNAFRELEIPCEHYGPIRNENGVPVERSFGNLDLRRARAILCIDDDIGWTPPTPPPGVPMYYWCIDTYRMDEPLYIQSTRRERIKGFDKVFFVQKKEAEAFGGIWLPVAVDQKLYRYEPQEPLYDFCFIGNENRARTDFFECLKQAFPVHFVGQAYGEDANRIYNQSRLAVNLSAGGDINMRMFEAQATSALLLSNRIDNGERELMPFLVRYQGIEECIGLMRAFLDAPAFLPELAKLQADSMEKHTYVERARAFLRSIDFELPPLPMHRFPGWQAPM